VALIVAGGFAGGGFVVGGIVGSGFVVVGGLEEASAQATTLEPLNKKTRLGYFVSYSSTNDDLSLKM